MEVSQYEDFRVGRALGAVVLHSHFIGGESEVLISEVG